MNKKKLLALLMALVMTLTLVPVTALAEETVMSTQDYETAVANVSEGGTVTLTGNVTYGTDHSVAVWEKGFNLDLGGHTFTTNSTVDWTASNNGYKTSAICFGNFEGDYANASVRNGTIHTSYGAGIYADGAVIVTLSDLNVAQNYPNYVQSTDEYSSAIRLTSKAKVIVESGIYTGKNAIAVSNSGGEITINNGTFTGDIFFSNSTNSNLTAADKKITINGGTFNGDFVNTNKGTLVIKGGTFDHDPTAYLADDYKAVNNNGTWTVSARYVAQIGEDKFESLAAAVAAVPDGTETTITMIADSVETGRITINNGQNILLDLAGHEVSYTESAPNNSVYYLTNKGVLTIQDSVGNGEIVFTASPYANNYTKEYVTIYNLDGTLNLLSGKITNGTAGGLAYAVNNSSNAWGQGDNKETVFNMYGGVVSAPHGDAAIRIYQNCADRVDPFSHNTLNITGGTVLDTGIFVDNNIYQATAQTTGNGILIDLNISGGTINGLIDLKLRHTFNTSLDITDGEFTNAKLRVRKQTDSSHVWDVQSEPTDPIVTISGGKWSFVNSANVAFNISSGWTTTSSWTNYKPYYVTDGVFNVDLNDYSGIVFESGKTGVANTAEETKVAYPYTVGVVAQPVAEVNGTQYTTLAAAIAAANVNGGTVTLLRNYDMEANEPGYGYTTSYVAQGENTPRDNMIEIGNGVTFNLGGYTLSNLFNNVFNVTGDNVTIKNGTMNLGQLYYGSYSAQKGVTSYANPTYGSYVMYVDGAKDLTIDDLTTFGGINVAGGSTAVINDLSFSGLSFYAVCSQENSVVTLNGGNYNKAVPGAANYLFWVESGSTMNITGGNYTKGTTTFINGVNPVITGGTFDFDPTNKGVAPGYEAVEIESNTKWQVGKVMATGLTQEDDTNENSATFTASKAVVDENEQNIGGTVQTTMTVTVTGYTDAETETVAQATLGNVMSTKLQTIVSNAIVAAGSGITSNTTQANVVIQVAKSAPTTKEGKVSYEVHPEAVISVNNVKVGTVRLANDQIDGTFSFKLNVSSIAHEGDYVRIDHMENNAVLDSKTYRVGEGDCVEITGITRFSIFVGERVDEQNASFTYLGASVRRRVQTSSPNIVVNTCTDMRFGFVVKNYDPFSSYDKYYFQWKKEGGNWSSPVEIINFDHTGGECVASLVITNIPQNFFDTKITAMIYKEGEAGSALEGDAMSVKQVANAIITKYGNGTSQKQWVDYAKYLTTQSGSYTVTYDENDHVSGYNYTA